MTKEKVLRLLRNAIMKVINGGNEELSEAGIGLSGGEEPSIKGPDDGWDALTLCWDGPFDWTMITGGCSLFAGELGKYSLPCEEEIQKALDAIRDAGYYLEVVNSTWLSIYDA